MIKTDLLTEFILFTTGSMVATLAFSGNWTFVYFLSTLSSCMFAGLIWILLSLAFNKEN